MSGVNMELRIVRLVATLGFFFTVVMAIVTIQNDESAWGYGVGAALLGFMAAYLWKDDLVAQGNAREREKAADITRSNQGHGDAVEFDILADDDVIDRYAGVLAQKVLPLLGDRDVLDHGPAQRRKA